MLVHFFSEELIENTNHNPGNSRNIGVVLSGLYGCMIKTSLDIRRANVLNSFE